MGMLCGSGFMGLTEPLLGVLANCEAFVIVSFVSSESS